MAQLFSDLIEKLIAEQTTVTIGSGENEMHGKITAFDRAVQVFTYAAKNDAVKHFIPLASVRSIGAEEAADGSLTCYFDMFKR